MSKIIAGLSGQSLAQVRQTIDKLESLSGFPSEDVRHLASSGQALRKKLSDLNLDPDDTTGEELYQALLAKYAVDAARIDKILSVSEDSTLAERVAKAGELVTHVVEAREIWCLKTSAAKQIIKRNPPKKLMKKLHYRSVDSLLKREDIASVFIGADVEEGAVWHKKTEAGLAKLPTTAYELRAGRVVNLDVEEFADFMPKETVLVNHSIGAAAVSPAIKANTPVLSLALLLLDGLESLGENHVKHRLHSIHPALNWWSGTKHLSMPVDDRLVSLNLKDVVRNHLEGNDYEARVSSGAQHEFWKGLMSRYKNYLDELPQDVATVESELSEHLLPQGQLVPEPIEAEI